MLADLLPHSDCEEYFCSTNLNLYAQPDCRELATQATQRRQLKIVPNTLVNQAIQVCLSEDNYSAWLPLADLKNLEPATQAYQAAYFSRLEIKAKIPQVIEFAYQAMNTPNYYLWGGTVPPNYDCSGLVQSAFASVGIWLPRDSYQQEAFSQTIKQEELQTGDLIFFGIEKVTHVAIYLDDGRYIHSSSKETGNNGIAINQLADNIDSVSTYYYRQLRTFGRIMKTIR